MDYKLAKLALSNFNGSTEVEIRVNDGVTYLVGINGSGKTMLGNAIQYLFEGKTFFNNKYRRRIITDGHNKMKVVGEFVHNESGKTLKISHSLTEKGHVTLNIEGGRESGSLGMNNVMEMINMLYLRPFEIVNKTPQEQAKYLGVDTTEYDGIIKDRKADLTGPRAEINIIKAKLKDYQFEPDKAEAVSLSELYGERDKINVFNQEQDERQSAIDTQHRGINQSESKIENLKEELKKEQLYLQKLHERLESLIEPEPKQTLDDVNAKIGSADSINKKAAAYNTWIELKEDLKTANKTFATKETEVTKAQEDKIAYIKSCKVAPSISFDDEGGLLISAFGQKNVYLKEEFFSRGQLIKMAIQFCLIKIVKDRNDGKDTIPVIFVDNAESLDDDKIKFIHDANEKHGIQFILAWQDTEPKAGKNCIMLQEKAIKQYKEEK
jgi:DNA repair exonuclease SbcCD ATPase subunit